ncbi:VWA domain-containing protein [uncultured Halopseudomonas sp.]|uniref:VWA domain-containing protein n=1 Tax=uncultured Halopseudomonas sp. TaxID=2901193 RepID=UPI0030EBA186|tara:strand:- start:30049 stop:31029 length:981 start_codon:yes stop_codon:yes gene_type:complete
MFELHWPAAFLLLPLPWLLRWLLPAAAVPSTALQVGFLPRIEQLKSNVGPVQSERRRWPFIIIWLLLLIAASRPQWLGEPLPMSISGRDMMLAVDLSGSMEYQDMQLDGEPVPRMAVVQRLVANFIAERQGDRLGLILFGSTAYVQAPLTHDLDSLNQWMDESFVGLAGRETAIGDAIGLSIKRLAEEPAESRVLVLITDGANTAGQVNPLRAARFAASEGIRIFTIGVGADRSQPTQIATRDPSVDLDEGTLVDVALATGGEYFRARNGQDIEDIYRRIDMLEPALRDSGPRRRARPLYPWPLGLAMLLTLAFAANGVYRRRHAD